MYKNLILEQRNSLSALQSRPFTPRSATNNAASWLKSDLVKVIVGPRRAGKSRFALHLLKDTTFAYYNFEDDRLNITSFDPDLFLKELHTVYNKPEYYFFDEIQNIPNWEIWINRLHRSGLNLIITGSNSKLLSGELTSSLTGRHIPIEILPFSYAEYQNAATTPSLTDFLERGGYPEVISQNVDFTSYLSVLLNSILYQDIVRRHNIRYPNLLDSLARHLITESGNAYSLRRLTRLLSFQSGVTLEKYLSYLIDTYLIFSLNRFSFKSSLRLKSPRKIYAVDNGLISSIAITHSPNSGKLFENLVFLELIKKGYIPNQTLFYYQTKNNREIDFVLKPNQKVTTLIQVAYSLTDIDTCKRETKALLEAAAELPGTRLLLITTALPTHTIPKDITVLTLEEYLSDPPIASPTKML